MVYNQIIYVIPWSTTKLCSLRYGLQKPEEHHTSSWYLYLNTTASCNNIAGERLTQVTGAEDRSPSSPETDHAARTREWSLYISWFVCHGNRRGICCMTWKSDWDTTCFFWKPQHKTRWDILLNLFFSGLVSNGINIHVLPRYIRDPRIQLVSMKSRTVFLLS